MKKVIILIILFFYSNIFIIAQEYIRLNNETSMHYEQLHYKTNDLHLEIKPYKINTYQNDSNSCAYKIIFDSKLLNTNFVCKKKEKVIFVLNPILDIMPTFDKESDKILHDYKLGLSANITIGKKLFINTDIFYGIASFSKNTNQFIDSTEIIPGYGKILSKKKSVYDYYNISAYISYEPTDYLNLQGGIGKNFWGEGYRSLFLSDNSNSYPFVKATVDIWKFKYVWMFSALKDHNTKNLNRELKPKLSFSHFLSWNATKWLNLNFFESIISNPEDSAGVTYFNISYLNPVIFFRPAEFAGGSADNALLGFGAKLKIFRKYQFYGQAVIDEFQLSEIKANNNWWGNKYGIQLGIKIFDFANLNNLFTRIEYNRVRPYTYSYSNSIMCYGNHYQALAHPAGANFEEALMQIHYFKKRYSFDLMISHLQTGKDIDNVSYGQNIYKSYNLRKDDYGNVFKQGLLSKSSSVGFTATYLLNQKINLAVQLHVNYLKQSINSFNRSTGFISLGIKTLLYDKKAN